MGLEDLAVYLRLAPEFGGTRFGPFEGLEVRLGADRDRSHIVLPESLGVVADHARLIRQGPGNLILAPADRTATIFLWKQGSRRPEQITTPTAIRPGDAFSLVTPNGPRFLVELDELPPEIKAQREEQKKRVGVGRRRLSAASMAAEGKRQVWSRLLVLGPMQLLQRAVVFVKSGAIYQPRNIFLGVTIIGGYLFGGVAMCNSSKSKKQFNTVSQKYEDCEESLNGLAARSGENIADWDFTDLAGAITNSPRVAAALSEDKELRELVKTEAGFLMADQKNYNWLITNPKNKQARDFGSWRENVMESKALDNETKAMVVWLAATPEKSTGNFDEFEDSAGEYSCGRGILRMSFRQGLRLGLDVQIDAYKPGTDSSSLDDTTLRDDLLSGTLSTAQAGPLPESIESEFEEADQGICLYVKGDDDREQQNRVLKQIEDHLGADAANAPPSSFNHATTTRIGKYWASDLIRVNLDKDKGPLTDFTDPQTPVSTVLGQLDSAGAWALKRTARTIAQSIVLPCRAKLEGDPKQMQGIFGEEGLPKELPCLVLAWKLQNEK